MAVWRLVLGCGHCQHAWGWGHTRVMWKHRWHLADCICFAHNCEFECFYSPLSRRIHISRATLDCLEGTYKTEDGHGRDRNEFLLKHNIDTFLICPQEESNRIDLNEPPKVQKTNRNWRPEGPFVNAINMNSVGTLLQNNVYSQLVKGFSSDTYDTKLWSHVSYTSIADLGLLYEWLTAQHMSFHLQGDQQTHQTCHWGTEQRPHAPGAHHSTDPGVQRHTHWGQGEQTLDLMPFGGRKWVDATEHFTLTVICLLVGPVLPDERWNVQLQPGLLLHHAPLSHGCTGPHSCTQVGRHQNFSVKAHFVKIYYLCRGV